MTESRCWTWLNCTCKLESLYVPFIPAEYRALDRVEYLSYDCMGTSISLFSIASTTVVNKHKYLLVLIFIF